MKVEVLVGSDEFFRRLREDMRRARDSVYLQAMTFEADAAGRRITDELRRSAASDIRILVDEYIRMVMSDSCFFSPVNIFNRDLRREARETKALFSQLRAEGIRVKMTNPLGFMYLRLLARNHKKLAVIDGRVAYIGGINFSDHNFAWHDMMLRIEENAVASYLADDFLATWSGVNRKNLKSFPGIEFHQLDGRSNESSYDSILGLIDAARDTVVIESPYLSFPFYSKLRGAVSRGVDVRLILPERNNKALMQRYNLWEARRAGIELRLLKDRMTHLKAMLIDDEHLIVGSSNFDYISYRFLQEIVAIIRDRDTIESFKERVLDADWLASQPLNGEAVSAGGLCYLYLRAVDLVGQGLARVTAQKGRRTHSM